MSSFDGVVDDHAENALLRRQKGESQNEYFMKRKHAKFSENEHFFVLLQPFTRFYN